MTSPYHRGERAVQARAGVLDAAESSGRAIRTEIPDVAARFLAAQPMLIAGSVDPAGQAWASILTGPPGFIRAVGPRTLEVDTEPAPGDPFGDGLAEPAAVGLLAIEFETRKRMRVNGVARHRAESGFVIDVHQVVANCPKYIAKRHVEHVTDADHQSRTTSHWLSADQAAWVVGADSFFIATSSSEDGGADVSHRGGDPGFVEVVAPDRLVWPDYVGNAMFLTLGNLEFDPAAGLVFADWQTGRTLQMTGRASVDWERRHAEPYPGAERLVSFELHAVVELGGSMGLRYGPTELSRFNPRPPAR